MALRPDHNFLAKDILHSGTVLLPVSPQSPCSANTLLQGSARLPQALGRSLLNDRSSGRDASNPFFMSRRPPPPIALSRIQNQTTECRQPRSNAPHEARLPCGSTTQNGFCARFWVKEAEGLSDERNTAKFGERHPPPPLQPMRSFRDALIPTPSTPTHSALTPHPRAARACGCGRGGRRGSVCGPPAIGVALRDGLSVRLRLPELLPAAMGFRMQCV